MSVTDLTGQRFGRLTVVAYDGKNGKHHMWRCKCDCGNYITIRGSRLIGGHTKSCGCLRKDIRFKHGQTHSSLYNRWSCMKKRCYNPKDKYYKSYGGRGIKVCEEWLNSFESFWEWANANGYNESLTLDRIDNNGNYEPDNCRWSDMTVQSNNRRSSRLITYDNTTMTIAEWSRHTGIDSCVLRARLDDEWPVEEALGYKEHVKRSSYRDIDSIRHVVIDGKKKSVSECAKECNVTIRTIYNKLNKLSEEEFIAYYHDMTNKKER